MTLAAAPARRSPALPWVEAFDQEGLRRALQDVGCAAVEGVLSQEDARAFRPRLEAALEEEAAYHGGDTGHRDRGMVLLCSLYDPAFAELFDAPRIIAPFETILGPGCIVYAYTSSSMPPGASNYSRRIHVDSPRLIPDYVTNVGMTLAVDDFTEDNGATYVLPGSHRRPDPPSEREFYAGAVRFIAPAGSALFFNARLWHAGGENRTGRWRHALTVNMGRPWMKQRLDVPRAMRGRGIDPSRFSERVQQKLGFFAQVPASYDEYYAPPGERPFRQPTE
ncbi:MAG TPA: phytanoyl-CoA dioxygenase family protein [Polyangiaceae bacterium LLY-WYZ-14_1]|nr:phytanoyl-CoA dioxygenase family protein [Polyangiaceae bacterium LLY-WYZ-14_1]